MKKTMCAVALLAIAFSLSADEFTEAYAEMYSRANTIGQKQSIVIEMIARGDPASAPVLHMALQDLLRNQPSVKDPGERAVLARTIGNICTSLGAFRYVEAAADVFLVIDEVADPQTRIEAILALGKMRATQYVERIAVLLSSLNGKPPTDRSSGEQLALACIVCLEKMRDPGGYSAVFYAMNAWYSDKSRLQAAASLGLMVEDPTEPIMQIVRTASPTIKIVAFRTELSSKAGDEQKMKVARYILGILNEYPSADKTEGLVLSEGRVLAVKTIVAMGGRDESDVELYKRTYQVGSYDERLVVVKALGENGTDAAAFALNDILLLLDDRKRNGVSDPEIERSALALINAIQKCGRKAAQASILAVVSNDLWSVTVLDLANKTLPMLK